MKGVLFDGQKNLIPTGEDVAADDYLFVDGATRGARRLVAADWVQRRFDTVQELLENRDYAPALGALVQAGPFFYEGAGLGARDYHVATASGAKLYVVPWPRGYDVQAFGAVDNADSGDYRDQIAAAFSAAGDSYIPVVVSYGTYRSSGSISASGVRRIEMDGEIYFFNSTDGLTIGRTSSVTKDMARADITVRVRGVIDAEGITGIICRGIWRSKVVAHVDGFEVGFEHRMQSGNNEYCAGCSFYLTLRNARVKLRFDQSTFCSSNQYYGLYASKQDEKLSPTIGVEWAENIGPTNNNIFFGAWLENNNIPILFRGPASNNIFHDARLENTGPIQYAKDGGNGGACNNLVYADISSDGLSVFSKYSGESPYPNFLESRVYGSIRQLIVDVTWRDWLHCSKIVNRHYCCPKLVNSESGRFPYGPDYFDAAIVDREKRTFVIGNSDGGYIDVPADLGDQLIMSIHHRTDSVPSDSTVVRIEALDARKNALASLGEGDMPYVGTSRHARTTGTTNLGNLINIQSDRVGLYSGIRINRSEVKWLRFVLCAGVEFHRITLFGVYDRHSGPALPDWRRELDIKGIDGPSEPPDFTGQFGFVRGGGYVLFGAAGKWLPVGHLCGRAFLSSGTVVISFDRAMPSTGYYVVLGGYANETLWVTEKSVSEFTINSSNNSSSVQVDYIVVPG